MRQDQIEIGGNYIVRVGDRLAPVTVLRQQTKRTWGSDRAKTVFVCRTGDTGREITAGAARLRPVPGTAVPESRTAVAEARRKQARAARQQQAAAEAALEVYHRAAQEFTPPWTAEGLRDHAAAWMARLPGEGAREDDRAAILRALAHAPSMPTYTTWADIARAGREGGFGGPAIRPVGVPGHRMIGHVNRDRLVEMPVGDNLAALRNRLGSIHVSTSLLEAARGIRRRLGRFGTRRLPVRMRRGLWLAVAQIHANNRAVYREVMGHEALPSPRAVAEAVRVACGLGRMPE
jgi:hypothetical protein